LIAAKGKKSDDKDASRPSRSFDVYKNPDALKKRGLEKNKTGKKSTTDVDQKLSQSKKKSSSTSSFSVNDDV